MTPRQRSTYFGTLWPAVCKAQGWNIKDENRRKCVTYGATGEESTSDLDQDQITLLFNKLKHLADPQNFDKALADSDPAAALAEYQRPNLIWRIIRSAAKIPGQPEAWLSKLCADRHGHSDWRKLPMADLLRFSMDAARSTTASAVAKRATKTAPKKQIA